MGQSVLVIGATGMLGTPVAYALKNQGYDVKVFSHNPDKAKLKFGSDFEIVQGNVEDIDSIKSALNGCYGVHINLNGGPTPQDYERIEHQGSANVANAANMAGVSRITYISGGTVCKENAIIPVTKSKYNAEQAIMKSGVAYTIFRPTWFMESLTMFVRDGKGGIIGKKHPPYRLIAADDYARMVAVSFSKKDAENKAFYIHGPDKWDIFEAFKKYCAAFYPDLKPSVIPIGVISLIATLKRNAMLKDFSTFVKYCEKMGPKMEAGDPAPANEILGKPEITLDMWIEKLKANK